MADKATMDKRAEHATLSWRLIEQKLIYYRPEMVHETWRMLYAMSDAEYDRMEDRYIELCLELGYENTLVHKVSEEIEMIIGCGCMEVDLKRYSTKLVLQKLSQPMRL